jgi:hypothetical protein
MIGGSNCGRGWEFLSSPPRPDRFWGPPNLLSNGYQGRLPCWWSGRGVKLITHLHLVSRSRMRGAIPPLPKYAFKAWRYLKKAQGQLYLYQCLSFSLRVVTCLTTAIGAGVAQAV